MAFHPLPSIKSHWRFSIDPVREQASRHEKKPRPG
jgi:hypothetical protein